MRALLFSALLGACITLSSFSVQATESPSPVTPQWQGQGVVRAIDAKTLLIQHDAIPALKWPAMTMPFAFSADVDLSAVKPGEPVTFTLVRAGDGFQIISLTPLR
ncbi:copper-binding protein [Leclercia sp. 119287]|uniref:copper-binding protein n=1 Tax=Leclercia TaxID=83654 RepID=UPI0012E0FE6D|nr:MULTISPECIES: copper-binding protein [Leclercia]MDK4745354.1 copper-binding protein [Leclercia adecarboxylata]QGU14317.1 copper-binding protein [Leclercia sp. 119287]